MIKKYLCPNNATVFEKLQLIITFFILIANNRRKKILLRVKKTQFLQHNKDNSSLEISANFLCPIFKESSLCIRIGLFTENKSVKDCMLRLSSQRTAPRGLILNFCVQTSPNFCTLSSICFSHENKLLFRPYFISLWKLS